MMRTALVGILAACAAPAMAVAQAPCTATTPAEAPCSCDVRTLRPLQGAIGLDEVRAKQADITARLDHERRDLEKDPIKLVAGPGGALFITDHHHGADAWRLAGHPVAVCALAARPPFASEAEFWAGLERSRLVRLADADGRPIAPNQLPATLADMPDDPYRSLAWRVRKQDGFCRSEMQKEFAEFAWADWMRARPELPPQQVRDSNEAMAAPALALVRSPAARGQPGFAGDRPPGVKCPK